MNFQISRRHKGFAEALLAGLSRHPKLVEPKWFYDAEGSRLFDQICALPEYYVTRTEIAILAAAAAEIATRIGPNAVIVEPGAGSTSKIRLLLDRLETPSAYHPSDISAAHLAEMAALLKSDYSALAIEPAAFDFTDPTSFPESLEGEGPVTVFFPGSTIGNFMPAEARELLRSFGTFPRAQFLLVGFDLEKDQATLEAAYDDAEGVTAAFNLNLLARANRELGSDFVLENFAHRAIWNAKDHRVEMHLVSLSDQTVHLGGEKIDFKNGETIHTENSHKFTTERFADLARVAGWRAEQSWFDEKHYFCVQLLRSEG